MPSFASSSRRRSGYRDRQVLYDRINARVDAMLAAGLVEEARQAYAACGPTARQAIGHKELLPYLEGREPLETAVERLKQETRRYATARPVDSLKAPPALCH